MSLSAFLAQNVMKPSNKKIAVSKRILDEEKKPALWELQALTSSEVSKLRGECTRRVLAEGKYKRYVNELDQEKFMGKMVARCVVYPDLTDAALQDSYHVMGEDALLQAMFTPGEYTDLQLAVQELNGFDLEADDLVKEAKN